MIAEYSINEWYEFMPWKTYAMVEQDLERLMCQISIKQKKQEQPKIHRLLLFLFVLS